MVPILLILVAIAAVVAVAVAAVSRVSIELEETIAPALLEVDDAVEAVAEAIPYEVSAVLSHTDVDQIIRWVLDWFDSLGMASDFGEELGGDWVEDDEAVGDEISAVDHAVARAVSQRADLDAVHVTVVVDEFLRYLRDIGAIGDEADASG